MKLKSMVFVLLIIFVLLFSLGMGERLKKPVLETENNFMDFTLQDLKGKEVTLSDYKGKVVFLNFWATWCPPCRYEMPSMQKLHELLQGKNFEILAVSIDRTDTAAVSEFVQDGKYTFRVLHDSDGTVARKYKIVSIPTTFIIDKNGKIADKVIGGKDWAEKSVVDKFKKLINQ